MTEKNLFQFIAILASIIGAILSFYFTLQTGSRNPSLLLVSMFVIWVLSPFAIMITSSINSDFWPTRNRLVQYGSIILLSILSALLYSGILKFPRAKPAFVFMAFPLLSLIILLILRFAVKKDNPVH